MRRILAFLVAPLVPILILSIIGTALGEPILLSNITPALFFVAYPLVIILGLPLDILFISKKENQTPTSAIKATTVLSIAIAGIYGIFDVSQGSGLDRTISISFFGYLILFWISASLTAICFTVIAYRNNLH